MSQTSVANPAAGLSGMVAESGGTTRSMVLGGSVGISAGTYVTNDGPATGGPDIATPPAAAADITSVPQHGGIAVLSTVRPPGGIAVGDAFGVLKEGLIWVTCENAATRGNPVYIRYAGTGTAGAVRDGAVTDETAALPRHFFAETTSGAGLVRVRVEAVS